jgi:hypothetical protein
VESYWPYLSTTWDYIHRSMPFGAAQTLTADDTYAITAYILYSAGLVDDDFELTHENFTEIRLPNESGFYVDDRDTVEVPLFTAEPCMTDCRSAPVVSFRATQLDVTPIRLRPAQIAGWDEAADHAHDRRDRQRSGGDRRRPPPRRLRPTPRRGPRTPPRPARTRP